MLALLACSLAAWLVISGAEVENAVAEIYKNGELLYTFDLSHERTTTIGDKRLYNNIEITDGAIRVIEANCPDKICVNTGFISNGIIPIICLPNRLEIRIVGRNSGVDAVAR
jgi:hypothetical protein